MCNPKRSDQMKLALLLFDSGVCILLNREKYPSIAGKLFCVSTLKSATYGGVIWAGVSLLLIAISLIQGDYTSWVELDFRPLTGTVLLGAEVLDQSARFQTLISYAQNGMPISVFNVIASAVLGFVDGFICGFFISVLYNYFRGESGAFGFSVLSFGLSFGIVFGVCSGILAAVSVVYSFEIETFDFSIKPLFLLFTQFEEMFRNEFLYKARESYIYFPNSFTGVFYWTLWGFLDGLASGAALAYIYSLTKRGSK